MVPRARWCSIVLVLGCSQTGNVPDDGQGGTSAGGSTGRGGGTVTVTTGAGGQAVTGGSGGHATGGAAGAPLPRCGDGYLNDIAEACDDGNNLSGDGCTSSCAIECTSQCGGCDERGACIPALCGNGRLEGRELCDDGGVADGDGCSHTCEIERGWFCPFARRPCVPICGDGKVTGPETCDDGNLIGGDGCSSVCLAEPNDASCDDGVIQGAEACDPPTGIAFTSYTCGPDCRYRFFCGDGNVDLTNSEECDLGVARNIAGYGDKGCMPNCKRSHYCGDGILDPEERCDLGENNNDSGACTKSCQVPAV